ncbi:anti-sigma factor [Pseudoduganella sp. OTU4001]|uniref:anti-sigma factor n=1 Tax=Pseudoduganella sp. OTU4001 TaxID=3043854 RepID=UPI00313EE0CB
MKSFSDEILMAYADGELDEVTRRAVEEAMRKDAALAHRVAQHKAMRANVFAAYAPIAEEAVPPRLAQPLRQATVVSLDSVRARREAEQQAARKAARGRGWSWPEWGALAAMLMVGVLAGHYGMGMLPIDHGETVASRDGVLQAQGRLATALEQQQGGSGGPVRIGTSFLSQEGTYCRSFMTAQDMAGLACKQGGVWKVQLALQNQGKGPQGEYRQAGAEMPPQVLEAIDQRISGQPLDAKAEQEALQRKWLR